MIAGTYQVNIRYNVNARALISLDSSLATLARKYRNIPVNISVTSNIAAVQAQLAEVTARFKIINSYFDIKSNIGVVTSQLAALASKKVTIPINYVGAGGQPITGGPLSGTEAGARMNSPAVVAARKQAMLNKKQSNYEKGVEQLKQKNLKTQTKLNGKTTFGVRNGVLGAGMVNAQYTMGAHLIRAPFIAADKAIQADENIRRSFDFVKATPIQKEQIKQIIEGISDNSGFNRVAVTEGLLMLARNKGQAEKIIGKDGQKGLFEVAIDTSIAGGVKDIKPVADLITDLYAASEAIGKDISFERAGEMIVQLLALTKHSLGGVNYALQNSYVPSLTKGADDEEIAALIAMSDAFFATGMRQGTSIKWLMNSLTGKNKKSKAIFKDMGLDFFNDDGSTKSFTQMNDLLVDKTKGMTDKQFTEFKELFHGEGRQILTAWRYANNTSDGGNAISAYKKRLTGIDTKRITERRRSEGVSPARDLFMSSIDRFWNNVYSEKVLDSMGKFFLELKAIMDGVTDLIRDSKAMDSVANVIGSVTGAFETIRRFFRRSDLQANIELFGSSLSILGGYIKGFFGILFDLVTKFTSAKGWVAKGLVLKSASDAMDELGKVASTKAEKALNKRFNDLKGNMRANEFASAMANPSVSPTAAVIKPNMPDVTDVPSYMDYLDKEQKQLLKPPISSSVSNGSPNQTIIIQKDAVNITGADVSQPHATKQAVTDGVKRAVTVDSDGFRIFDLNGG